MKAIVLENEALRLAFDGRTGALISLRAPESQWDILDRGELGLSFRLLVPTRSPGDWHVPGRRNNPVLGERQTLSSVTVARDGCSAMFIWDGVVSKHAGRLPIKVTVEVELRDRQAVWTATIENRSEHTVENV